MVITPGMCDRTITEAVTCRGLGLALKGEVFGCAIALGFEWYGDNGNYEYSEVD